MSLDYLAAIGGPPQSKQADVLLAAIKYQESDGIHTHQRGGSARGLWQFEKITIKELFRVYPDLMNKLCDHYLISNNVEAVYQDLLINNKLAIALARLLLYKDPLPLPEIGDIEEAWIYYIRNWKPGRPNKQRWSKSYSQALKEVTVG